MSLWPHVWLVQLFLPTASPRACSYSISGFALYFGIRMLLIQRDRAILMATGVKLGGITGGGSKKMARPVSGWGGQWATLGLSGLTDHVNTHEKSFPLLLSGPAACCHSLVESIVAHRWSHITMQPKVTDWLCVTETRKNKLVDKQSRK